MSDILALDRILIDRPARQRTTFDPKALAELQDSISRIGLIHPPVITRERQLVAGERRILAMKNLGMTATRVTYTDELRPEVLHLIELEENLKRSDLSWQDRTRAVVAYHETRLSTEDRWSLEDTAKGLGFSPRVIAGNIMVAKELAKGNPLIEKADKFSVALGLAERNAERRKAEQLAGVKAAPVLASARGLAPGQPAPAAKTVTPPIPETPIIHKDFHEWAPQYVGHPFNFLHCDFPYGVNADKRQQGTSTVTKGSYVDSPDIYWNLLECLASNLERLASPSAHIMFWFSMDYYSETLRFFSKHTDFVMQPFPLYWSKSDNVGLLPDPSRGPRRVVETALIGSRGDRKIVQAVANHFACASIRDEHMSVKPPAMLSHFFRMFVDEYTSILDPTCGSGSSLRAAKSAGASRLLGLERNAEFARRAQALYRGETP